MVDEGVEHRPVVVGRCVGGDVLERGDTCVDGGDGVGELGGGDDFDGHGPTLRLRDGGGLNLCDRTAEGIGEGRILHGDLTVGALDEVEQIAQRNLIDHDEAGSLTGVHAVTVARRHRVVYLGCGRLERWMR
jgi:hypothetical protein